MSKLLIGYITAPNKKTAQQISLTLLSKNLIACANILQKANSIYRWKGRLIKENEVIVLIKTRKGLEDCIVKEIKKVHPYEIPCIEFFEAASVNKEYLDWVCQEVKK